LLPDAVNVTVYDACSVLTKADYNSTHDAMVENHSQESLAVPACKTVMNNQATGVSMLTGPLDWQ